MDKTVSSAGTAGEDAFKQYLAPFAIVLSAGFMTLLDVSIVNVALPSIESALNTQSDELQWIVAGYALTFGLTLVAAGRAGDIFGRRRLFIGGLTAFVLASLGCGLAPSGAWLIVLRLVQGAAAGVVSPQTLGLIQDMFKGKARARAFGIFGIVVGISTALGPVLGGLLIALVGPEHGWRYIFLINVPIGMVVIPLAARWLPKEPLARDSSPGTLLSRIDPIGVVLMGGIVLFIMWPFLSESGAARDPGSTGAPYWMLGVAAGLIAVLVHWEKFLRDRGSFALLEPVLYKDPSYVLGLIAMFFYFGGFTSIFLVVTLYLQQGLGWTALSAGLASVPFALVTGAVSGISGSLVNRFGRAIPLIGSTTVVVGILAMGACAQWLPENLAPVGVIVSVTFAAIGSGLFISPNQALTLEHVRPDAAGLAAAMLQTIQRLGTAVGLSIITTVYFVSAVNRAAVGSSEGVADTVLGVKAHSHALALASLGIAAGVSMAVVANIVDVIRREKDSRMDVTETYLRGNESGSPRPNSLDNEGGASKDEDREEDSQ